MAYDIEPKHKSIKKADFLKLDTDVFKKTKSRKILVIGNPPFGHNSSLAKKFIKKCATFSDHIAFILPKSFRSDSYMKAVPIDFHPVIDVELDTDIFIYPDTMKPKKLQTLFMYFQRQSEPRKMPKKYVPNDNWKYIDKNAKNIEKEADFRVVRCAGKVGKCYIRGDPKYKIDSEIKTDYYIKLKHADKKTIKRVCEKIGNHEFQYNNVSKTLKSVNKNQLTKYINSIL